MCYSNNETKRIARCFKDFPYECGGCDYYKEKMSVHPPVIPLLFFSRIPPTTTVLTKECTQYHKKIEEIITAKY